MVRYLNKNKNELLVLTGAVYSFVAYLTAFTLEVLFIIDLAKQSPSLGSSTSSAFLAATFEDNDDLSAAATTPMSTFEQAKLVLESMQSHLTISCLAISVLYFLTFVASLLLVISLILRSTFMLLVWMCSVATLYLPEFGLIIYVSVYGWGIDSRNGQTELIFYLIRAALNVIFVHRAYRLWKDWNYEKNFFLFSKSSKRFSAATYDSPYFIHGDSLSTTINPVFSSSTLHLDRYDQIRDCTNVATRTQTAGESSFRADRQYDQPTRNSFKPQRSSAGAASYDLDDISARKSFYLGEDSAAGQTKPKTGSSNRPLGHHSGSVLSFNDNDEFEDCEMDLDYRTLTQQRHYSQGPHAQLRQPPIDYDFNYNYGARRAPSNQHSARDGEDLGGMSPGGLSYSTQSLDRRHIKDVELNLPEQVILRPLGHQPFDYLYRPGSTHNLASSNNFSAHPTVYSSSSRLTKRDDLS